ncbi:MAG: hypothetical protein JWO22_2762 [Frankiales bacterium]|nr:hypothetical protein [Frankiales bacterium]
MKHRTMTAKQKAGARKSARRHGRSQPGLWENVNASKGRGPKATKGKTRPGRRSKTRKTGAQKRRARRRG